MKKRTFLKVVSSILVLAFFLVIAVGSEDVDPQTQREANEIYREVLGRDGPYKNYGKGLQDAARLKTFVTAVDIAMLGVGTLLLFTPAATAGAILIAGALITMPISHATFSVMESRGEAIAKNPTATDYEVVAGVEPVEPFVPVDNSEFMIARAGYLTRLAEQVELSKALTDSFSRMQVAVDAREAEHAFLQVKAAAQFIEMLQENLSEQKELILIQKSELIKYFSFSALEEEPVEDLEINFEAAVDRFKEMSIRGISEEERAAMLEAGLTVEEVEAFEAILAGPFHGEEWDLFSAEALEAGMDEQLESIDGMLAELAAAWELLNRLIELAESIMYDMSELDDLHTAGGAGGGIYVGENSSAELTGNIISDNIAVFGGGIAVLGSSTAIMEDNLTGGNSARFGGGILVVDSEISMVNNTICGNAADFGAGLLAFMEALVTAGENSFEENRADRRGGAIWACNQSLLELETPGSNSYLDNTPDDIYYNE